MKWTLKKTFIAGSALILVVNGIVLAGAAYNRSGEESRMRLSQRELRPAAVHDELDSALQLRLRWRVLGAGKSNPAEFDYGEYRGAPEWLDAKKMAELGFDTTLPDGPDDARRSFSRQQSREVFLVLEFDGPAYEQSRRRAMARAEALRSGAERGDPRRPIADPMENAERIVRRENEENSRLFVVDAGLDDAPLRAKYPDRAHYAVVRGQVGPVSRWQLPPNDSAIERMHRGSVRELSIAEVHVPAGMRRALEGATPAAMEWRSAAGVPASRYEAEIAFGRRLEPWLAAAARK